LINLKVLIKKIGQVRIKM